MNIELVDVFGAEPFCGNPVAVVRECEETDTGMLLRIAQWLNLSETTFLMPPIHSDADYRVRIFTLERELPFAGHPTLGTCHAWLRAGGVPKQTDQIVQECGAGLIPILRDAATNGLLQFRAPPLIRTGSIGNADLEAAARVLQIDRSEIVDAVWADNGPGWMAIMLPSAQAVLDVRPLKHFERRIEIGLVGAHPKSSETAFELRALFSDQHGNVIEDPVTGSLNASVASWLLETGRVAGGYLASQGTILGRKGRVKIDVIDGNVWVGGATETMFAPDAW